MDGRAFVSTEVWRSPPRGGTPPRHARFIVGLYLNGIRVRNRLSLKRDGRKGKRVSTINRRRRRSERRYKCYHTPNSVEQR